uniref:Uncharacterized protein n=1 Tax=Anguilla anguilla TaxID=7936 RepID=A0A0E9XAD2_ANGAN
MLSPVLRHGFSTQLALCVIENSH